MDIGQAIEDLQSLDAEDLRKVGSAPVGVRILIIVAAIAVVLGAGIWLLVIPKMDLLKSRW